MGNLKVAGLHHLTKLFNIQNIYYDVYRKRKFVSPESLLAILKSFGIDINSNQDIIDISHSQKQYLMKRFVSPVLVAWNGKLDSALVLPEEMSNAIIHCHIQLEGNDFITWDYPLKKARILEEKKLDNKKYVKKNLSYIKTLPFGYHRLAIHTQNQVYHSLVISAPRMAYVKKFTQKDWGLFAPLYSLHSKNSIGCGDLTDLNKLMKWVCDHGGNLVGTLPLFANFLQEPFEPSPYSPISKFFFNEIYLDIKQIPEFKLCQQAQKIFHTDSFNKKMQKLCGSDLIDYQKTMGLKRKIIELLAKDFFSKGTLERHKAFQDYCQYHPEVLDYANFRAFQEVNKNPWPLWPDKMRLGIINEGDYNTEVKNYYLYAQWQIHQQLTNSAQLFIENNIDLYLDMPLGVHPYGYDVWRNQQLFASDLDVGSPPDAVFVHGQNWGFPPLIPYRLRASHYHYLIQSLRQVMPYVNLLRLDHVMSLHRLYCVPKGFESKDGAYIRYASDDMYAILSLESQRYKTSLIGENLGTVPFYINKKLAKHRLYSMFVLQYEMDSLKGLNCKNIKHHSIVSLNTHDMPTFSAYCLGLDIKERKKAKFLNAKQAKNEWLNRKILNPLATSKLPVSRIKSLLQDFLYKLASGRSQFLLINIEDLWQEVKPQNIPGSKIFPNWRRKFKLPFESWRQNRFLCATLNNVDIIRKKKV